jgi:hypothetical protein
MEISDLPVDALGEQDRQAQAEIEEVADPVAEHDPAEDEPPSRRPARKARGRASVPSWDEIMFGGPNE